MYNRESILKKINEQEKEWDKQSQYLQAKLSNFDSEKRLRLEKHVDYLNSKLRKINERTSELKRADERVWNKHGESIRVCWEELTHNMDFVISNYIRIFNL